MNAILAAWNAASRAYALEAMLACCGARRWAEAMVEKRPMQNIVALSEEADRAWATMQEEDWIEAFACHPRIGEKARGHMATQSAVWSHQEQASASAAPALVMTTLAALNEMYEQRFGFTYIVCATGKSAEEMLAILKRRLDSDRALELREAAEQQRLILQIRLGKWLAQ
jgi:OHCU decarboxylase